MSMTNNNQSEEVERILEIFDEEAQGESGFLLTMDPTDYPDVREWVKHALTTHGASEYARGKSGERERIEAIFKEHVPPHAMDLEDSVWLKRLLNKAFHMSHDFEPTEAEVEMLNHVKDIEVNYKQSELGNIIAGAILDGQNQIHDLYKEKATAQEVEYRMSRSFTYWMNKLNQTLSQENTLKE